MTATEHAYSFGVTYANRPMNISDATFMYVLSDDWPYNQESDDGRDIIDAFRAGFRHARGED